jgi:hypothetical protein
MPELTQESGNGFVLSRKSLLVPHRLVLIVTWLLTTAILIAMLVNGVRNTGRFRVERLILQAVYVGALIWHLSRSGPSMDRLPDIPPFFLKRWSIAQLIPLLAMAFILWASFTGDGSIVTLVMMVATPWVLVAWRREIRLRPILLGLALSVIALLGGFLFWDSNRLTTTTFVVLLALVPPMFVAGGLLFKRTGLGGSQLYEGEYGKAVVSFLQGCLLFIPLGLFNAASGAPGPWMFWVNRWWIPVSQPWFSGIVEEAWFRLFLVSLGYFVLRPLFRKRPVIAIILSALFSAITFGLWHGGTLLMDRFLTIGLLFGLPMAVVFARRDWEHTVGAHYMINMIPTLIVFLET